VTLYDIKQEGKTAGQKKMTGMSDDGSLNGGRTVRQGYRAGLPWV
jgi:hypothetical protein